MEDKNDVILTEMEGTRTSLTEKLEALETQLAGKVQAGADVVDHATEAAVQIVESVKETVQGVTDKVEEAVHNVTAKVEQSVQSVTSAFDIRRQTDRHPWMVMGIAATAGCMLGSFLGRRSQRANAAPEPQPKSVKGSNGNGHSQYLASGGVERRASVKQASHLPDWVTEQMHRLKGLALGALLSAVRDVAKRSIPGTFGERIAEEIESFTTQLGAEPIHGPVFGEDGDAQPAQGQPFAETNRLRTGGSGTNLR
jgi:ElaB/YqjD/DUF883 family membrane-anchored ribosome-binding protein